MTLRVLDGGLAVTTHDRGIVVGPAGELLRAPALPVIEDDTYLVVGAPVPDALPDDVPNPLAVLADAKDAEALATGTVIARGRALHAIVHDLARTPSTTAAVVEETYRALAARLARARVPAIALRPLGRSDAHLGLVSAVRLLLAARPTLAVDELRVVVDPAEAARVRALLGAPAP